jgi:glycosyltransferase involved in cell wall biosynthesis
MYSLVIPVYRNEESLQELVSQLTVLDRSLGHRLETVFVVDGSPDNSYSYLRHALPRTGLSAKLVLLSRNFGSFAAIRAGLTEASGPHSAVLAADLQEPPDVARQFFAALEADAADVVIGTRMDREDPLLSRWAAVLCWSLYRRLVQPELPPGGLIYSGAIRFSAISLFAWKN